MVGGNFTPWSGTAITRSGIISSVQQPHYEFHGMNCILVGSEDFFLAIAFQQPIVPKYIRNTISKIYFKFNDVLKSLFGR